MKAKLNLLFSANLMVLSHGDQMNGAVHQALSTLKDILKFMINTDTGNLGDFFFFTQQRSVQVVINI